MPLSIPSLIISIVLFFVLFYGIGFLLNMLFRASWIMAVLFPIVSLYIINNAKFTYYLKEPINTISHLGERIASIQLADIIILGSGFLGAIAAGVTMKYLRKKGYQMF
ncbi:MULTISPECIES: YuiB family protein [Bacillus]|uniref:YuiB family protein n=1 Tax=Bacillus TaxID=1386 RepID=UPI00030E598D|nr:MULTISPECIES: YuiB family protein [Bacillus]